MEIDLCTWRDGHVQENDIRRQWDKIWKKVQFSTKFIKKNSSMYPIFIVPFAVLFFSILSYCVSRERWDKWAFLTRPSNPLKTVKNFVKTCVHTVIWVLEEKIIEFFTSYILNCTNHIQNVHAMSSNMNQKLWCWMWITKNLWKFFYDISNNQNQIMYL